MLNFKYDNTVERLVKLSLALTFVKNMNSDHGSLIILLKITFVQGSPQYAYFGNGKNGIKPNSCNWDCSKILN